MEPTANRKLSAISSMSRYGKGLAAPLSQHEKPPIWTESQAIDEVRQEGSLITSQESGRWISYTPRFAVT